MLVLYYIMVVVVKHTLEIYNICLRDVVVDAVLSSNIDSPYFFFFINSSHELSLVKML